VAIAVDLMSVAGMRIVQCLVGTIKWHRYGMIEGASVVSRAISDLRDPATFQVLLIRRCSPYSPYRQALATPLRPDQPVLLEIRC
jgi:hypothetical protein